MELTVGRALAAPPLDRARIIAGRGGIERVIRHVDVVDAVELPDVVDWVREGELVLTTGYAQREELCCLIDVIPRLVERQASGLVIKTGLDVSQLPSQLLQVADCLELPLIELHAHTTYIEALDFLLRTMQDRQTTILRQSKSIHRRFSELVFSGGGLDDIASTLSGLLGASVAIVGSRGEFLSLVDSKWEEPLRELMQQWLPEGQSTGVSPKGVAQVPLQGGLVALEEQDRGEHRTRAIASGVRIGAETPATLLVWDLSRPTTSLDFLAIEHATTIVALKLMQTRSVREAELRHLGNFLDDLISGQFSSQAVIAAQGRGVGWDAKAPYAVAVLDIAWKAAEPDLNAMAIAAESDRRAHPLLDAAMSAIQEMRDGCVSWMSSARIVVLLPCKYAEDHAKAQAACLNAAESIRGRLEEELARVRVWIGVGRPQHDQVNLQQSYEEALTALGVAQQLAPEGSLRDFASLGIYRILCGTPDREELHTFVSNEIGPLLSYDEEHQTELVKTLGTFLRSGGSLADSARKLWVHPNTVKYRLGRISEMIGPFRELPDKRLAIEVALRVHSLLRGR